MAELVTHEEGIKRLTARCYCKDAHFHLDIPTSALPLPVHICHCSICRQTHGSFCVFHANLPDGVAPRWVAPSNLACLTPYRHQSAKSVRYFCSTCGCHIGDQDINDGHWVVSTSIFDANRDDSPPVWGTKEHTKVEATRPSLLDWLPKDPNHRPEATSEEPPEPPTYSSELRASCHCGGVSFSISRPTPEMQRDPDYKPWLSPSDPSKWLAVMDVCDDCRLVSGVHVMPWTFVPRSCLHPAFPEDMRLGTSKTYASSEGNLRSFCGTCGATVAGYFGAYETRRLPNGERMVDVACGLLREPRDMFAEEWLTWRTGRLVHRGSGVRYDEKFTEDLAEGMKAWGLEKHGDAPDYEIG